MNRITLLLILSLLSLLPSCGYYLIVEEAPPREEKYTVNRQGFIYNGYEAVGIAYSRDAGGKKIIFKEYNGSPFSSSEDTTFKKGKNIRHYNTMLKNK